MNKNKNGSRRYNDISIDIARSRQAGQKTHFDFNVFVVLKKYVKWM